MIESQGHIRFVCDKCGSSSDGVSVNSFSVLDPPPGWKAMSCADGTVRFACPSCATPSSEQRIINALEEAFNMDDSWHKQYAIDKMVRALTGCVDGQETAEYRAWVAAYCAGKDGPNTYSWDTGIAP